MGVIIKLKITESERNRGLSRQLVRDIWKGPNDGMKRVSFLKHQGIALSCISHVSRIHPLGTLLNKSSWTKLVRLELLVPISPSLQTNLRPTGLFQNFEQQGND